MTAFVVAVEVIVAQRDADNPPHHTVGTACSV
jgi:hypothetical protein